MARFLVLIGRVLFVVGLLGFRSSFAITCADPGISCSPVKYDVQGANPPYDFSSGTEAATAFAAWKTSQETNGTTYAFVSCIHYYAYEYCKLRKTTAGGAVTEPFYYMTIHCANAAAEIINNNGVATCAVNDGGADDCSTKPTLGGASTSWIGKSDSSVACIGGCAYSKSDGEGYWSNEHKVSVYKGKMSPLGGACSAGQSPVYTNDPAVTGTEPTSGVPSDTPKPDSCKPGQVPAVGTVNGKSVPYCAGADKSVVTSTSQKDATSSASSPSGASSGSKSETETKSTTCADGRCTTTTTKSGSTDGGAGAGGTSTSDTETKTESQADYCKDNPAQPICKEDGDSSFGGSCGAFNCDGDAVQCAIAREQHQRNCQLFDDRTPMTEIGEGAAGAGNRPSDHPGNNPEDIDVGARMAGVARDNPFGDACPRDFDLAVMGNVVTVPLSNACDVLKLMGEIAVAFAFIAAARVVMSGVSSGAT